MDDRSRDAARGGEVMHKMDWTIVDHRCLDLALRELVRQLDERFAKREEFEEHSKWLISQQTAAWDRIQVTNARSLQIR